MDTQKQQVIERLNQATNILVTVSSSPSIDQLSAAIGITLLLNKLSKHATAVFSGDIPDVIEFLNPEKTLEKNTDSLRDFIISLDKSKADKLRYKVEDDHVKIFITPYKTSISDKDLVFSQGDFNVDVVLTLGVREQSDLDRAITAHGRILHDATVISIDNEKSSQNLGSIVWSQPTASSLCEMMVSMVLGIKPEYLDEQIANAFLSGIVKETDRFSNDKTSSETLDFSSKLLAAGGNQQLVVSKLQPPIQEPKNPIIQESETQTPIENAPLPAQPPVVSLNEVPESIATKDTVSSDGSLVISHDTPSDTEEKPGQISIDDEGKIAYNEDQTSTINTENKTSEFTSTDSTNNEITDPKPEDNVLPSSRLIVEPPTLGGTLTASGLSENYEGSSDAMTDANPKGIIDRGVYSGAPSLAKSTDELEDLINPKTPAISNSVDSTLEELEKSVGSPHVTQLNQDDTSDAITSSTPQLTESKSENEGNSGEDGNQANLELPSISEDKQQDPTVAPPSVPPPMMPPAL